MRKESSELLLLDLNVLVAIAWPNHQFHQAALRRLDQPEDRWATCALTEIGFIRLSSNASVVGTRKSPMEAALVLAAMMEDSRHVFLDSMPSPLSLPFLGSLEGLMGYRQVTDAYLLALATHNRAVLLTFDSRIAAAAGTSHKVEILS